MCPACRQSVTRCRCSSAAVRVSPDGVVRVSIQTKGRAGKGVTLVQGLALEPVALAALGKHLKTECGSGGTVKDGVIEVQGDHRERIVDALMAQGFAAKRVGS